MTDSFRLDPATGTLVALALCHEQQKLTPPTSWPVLSNCTTPSKSDAMGQGPFFIHDAEKSDDVSLFRQDIRGKQNIGAELGVELELHIRVLSTSSTNCAAPVPVPNVEVYIWHPDASGYFSGFPGQHPDEPYTGSPGQNSTMDTTRFCRGAQLTNSNGVASFRTVYPGWFSGTEMHIAVMLLKPAPWRVAGSSTSRATSPIGCSPAPSTIRAIRRKQFTRATPPTCNAPRWADGQAGQTP